MISKATALWWAFIFLLIAFLTGYAGAAGDGPKDIRNGASASTDATSSVPGEAGKEEMSDIIDIRPPVTYGFDPRLLFLLLAAAVVLVAAIVLALWRRRRAGKRDRTPLIVSVPEDEAAVDALRDLEARTGIPDREFYYRMTAVVRDYLDRRFDTDTLERTSEEIVPILRGLEIDPELRSELIRLLRGADPVKFASMPAGTSRRKADLEFALDFVRRTRRSPHEEVTIRVPV